LNLSTEGNHLVPHEFIDRDESISRVSFSCSSEFLDFPLIYFKLGDDLLGVAHLLPCDHVVKIWWELVLICPQIGSFFVGGDFLGAVFLLIHNPAKPPLHPS
jgi:hypothetical protein